MAVTHFHQQHTHNHKRRRRIRMSNPPVTPTETPSQAIAQVGEDIASDVAAAQAVADSAGVEAVKSGAETLYTNARAEYDALTPALQARLHQLLNDLEVAGSVSLGSIHTLFGAK